MKHVAVGILWRDGTVLACQRKRGGAYPLKWEFPGGKIEQGESPQQALVRELREELAIDAVIGDEIHRQSWGYPGYTPEGGTAVFDVIYFGVGSFTGEPVNRAFEQIRWVSPAALEGMDILEGNREAVRRLVVHANRNAGG